MTQPANTQGSNRLSQATSPYLLQHADNPIDWYEWGDEAFARAMQLDRPIFLSIGYSACHWCHVMAHETFEDEGVAEYLNGHFVSIKVDREERPDVDEIYMHITQLMNQGQGGWPMSVFLTPDREPIFAGTYFPRDTFIALANQIDNIWTNEREKVTQQTQHIQGILEQWSSGAAPAESVIPFDLADRVAHALAEHMDRQRGGFQTSGNKFPPSMAMELMLRVHRRTGDAELLSVVEITLDNMARGGIYDHLGGGICRYSTDPDWLVPHFEKMLYDQALVSSIYLDAYQVTGDERWANVARDIFRYVINDLQSPEGGFYSTRDADSEGLEGAYYIWTVEQVRAVLGEADAKLFCSYYDVSPAGNWFESRGHAPSGPKNILHVTEPVEAFAKAHDMSADELRSKLAAWREKMLAAREQRVPPGLDDKILTAWNGLMIASLAKGAQVLDEPEFAQAAARAADFVTRELMQDGRLLRTHRDGRSRLTGYLSDYAYFVEGLINLYEATFDDRWIQQAVALTDNTIRYYHDADNGGFFFTAHDAEELIARPKSASDGAIPAANAVMALNLIRLGKLLYREQYLQLAEQSLRTFKPSVESSPAQHERLLCAVDMYHDRVKEIAIVGDPRNDATKALVRTVFDRYLPNKVVALSAGGDAGRITLLKGKTLIDGSPAAYVCENHTCQRPVTDPEALAAQLPAGSE